MSRTFFVPLFCASLVFVTTGCYTLLRVDFVNETATAVKVRSSHTGQEISVPSGKLRRLPHAVGDLTITTQTNGQYKFSGVAPFDVDDDYLVKRGSLFGPGYVTLTVRLETNMLLYAVVPGKKTVDHRIHQPNGYPKVGAALGH
jgi:hypothetical protein